MTDQPTFTEQLQMRIRVVMLEKNVTQDELGRRLGWVQTMVSRRLTGKTPISAEDVVRIADALEVTVQDLGFPLVTTSGKGVR